VPQELENGRNGCVEFPAGDGLFVNANLVGNVPSVKFEVETVGADMIV
jgi:hypothetical protein